MCRRAVKQKSNQTMSSNLDKTPCSRKNKNIFAFHLIWFETQDWLRCSLLQQYFSHIESLHLKSYEPRHEKTCLYHMRTTKVQISLGIRSLISTFVVRCLDSRIPLVSISKAISNWWSLDIQETENTALFMKVNNEALLETSHNDLFLCLGQTCLQDLANSVDPDQTAPEGAGVVWSELEQFAIPSAPFGHIILYLHSTTISLDEPI